MRSHHNFEPRGTKLSVVWSNGTVISSRSVFDLNCLTDQLRTLLECEMTQSCFSPLRSICYFPLHFFFAQ